MTSTGHSDENPAIPAFLLLIVCLFICCCGGAVTDPGGMDSGCASSAVADMSRPPADMTCVPCSQSTTLNCVPSLCATRGNELCCVQ